MTDMVNSRIFGEKAEALGLAFFRSAVAREELAARSIHPRQLPLFGGDDFYERSMAIAAAAIHKQHAFAGTYLSDPLGPHALIQQVFDCHLSELKAVRQMNDVELFIEAAHMLG